jgi:hypothetical protein
MSLHCFWQWRLGSTNTDRPGKSVDLLPFVTGLRPDSSSCEDVRRTPIIRDAADDRQCRIPGLVSVDRFHESLAGPDHPYRVAKPTGLRPPVWNSHRTAVIFLQQKLVHGCRVPARIFTEATTSGRDPPNRLRQTGKWLLPS